MQQTTNQQLKQHKFNMRRITNKDIKRHKHNHMDYYPAAKVRLKKHGIDITKAEYKQLFSAELKKMQEQLIKTGELKLPAKCGTISIYEQTIAKASRPYREAIVNKKDIPINRVQNFYPIVFKPKNGEHLRRFVPANAIKTKLNEALKDPNKKYKPAPLDL